MPPRNNPEHSRPIENPSCLLALDGLICMLGSAAIAKIDHIIPLTGSELASTGLGLYGTSLLLSSAKEITATLFTETIPKWHRRKNA